MSTRRREQGGHEKRPIGEDVMEGLARRLRAFSRSDSSARTSPHPFSLRSGSSSKISGEWFARARVIRPPSIRRREPFALILRSWQARTQLDQQRNGPQHHAALVRPLVAEQ